MVLEPGSKVEKLTGGFHRLAGGTVDPSGRFYAVDARRQRIYRWTERDPLPELIADQPLEPVNLASDKAGNLLVVSHAGSVYALAPDKPAESIQVLQAHPAANRPGLTAIVPQNYWMNGYEVATGKSPKRPAHFVSPDGTTFLPAGEDFMTGKLTWGVKDHDLLRAYGLTPATPGKPIFITLEWDGKTYSTSVDNSGEFSLPKLFAERGGEAVVADSAGNVYIAAGQIFVHDSAGKLIEIITVPERPLGLAFGGKDGRTLYIPAGESLYVARTRVLRGIGEPRSAASSARDFTPRHCVGFNLRRNAGAAVAELRHAIRHRQQIRRDTRGLLVIGASSHIGGPPAVDAWIDGRRCKGRLRIPQSIDVDENRDPIRGRIHTGHLTAQIVERAQRGNPRKLQVRSTGAAGYGASPVVCHRSSRQIPHSCRISGCRTNRESPNADPGFPPASSRLR